MCYLGYFFGYRPKVTTQKPHKMGLFQKLLTSSPVSRSMEKAQKYREIGTPEFFICVQNASTLRPQHLYG